MTATPRLGLSQIGTGGKNISVNDSMALLDMVVQPAVLDKDLATPPGSPAAGDMYIVGASPTGAWSGHAGHLALYFGGWIFKAPHIGFGPVYVADELLYYVFDATSAWVIFSGGGAGGGVKVRAATTANITIATALNAGDVLDGVTLAANDLVLVKDQSSAAQNGLYRAGVSPARDSSFTDYDDLVGVSVVVEEGTANADKVYLCTSNAGGTIGVTGVTFSNLSSAITFSSLIGISLTAPAAGDMLRYNGSNWVNEKPPYDVGISRSSGAPIASQIMLDFEFNRTVVFASGLTGSVGHASVAATAQTDFDIQKNGSSVGTMRFAAAGTTASFIMASATTFNSGDLLKVVAPASPDATLASIVFNLAGARS